MATWQVAGNVFLSLLLLLVAPLPSSEGMGGPPPSLLGDRGGPRLIRVDERRCLSVEPITKYLPVPRPYMCHPTMPAIPLPPQPDTQSAMLLLGLKMAGWRLCEKPVMVPLRRLQKRRTCCPGWLPSRDGGCNTKAPVTGPCQNGGYISTRPGPPMCSCPPGFVGIYCQIRVPSLPSVRTERPFLLPPGPLSMPPLPPMGLMPPMMGMRPPAPFPALPPRGRPPMMRPRPTLGVKVQRTKPARVTRPPVLYSPVPDGLLKKLPPLPPFPLGPISPVFGSPFPTPPRRSRPRPRPKLSRVLVTPIRKPRPKYRLLTRRPPPALRLMARRPISPKPIPRRPIRPRPRPIRPRPVPPRPSVVITRTRTMPRFGLRPPTPRLTVFSTNQGRASSVAHCQRILQMQTVRCFQAAGVISSTDGLFNPFSPEILRQICGMGHRLVPCIMANERACGSGLKVIMSRRMLSSFMSSVGRMCAVHADTSSAVEADTGLGEEDDVEDHEDGVEDPMPRLIEDPIPDLSEHELCENGGSEVEMNGDVVCSCPPGFEGWRCETQIGAILTLEPEQDGILYDSQGDGGDYQNGDLHPDVQYADIPSSWVTDHGTILNHLPGDPPEHVDSVAVTSQEASVAVPTQDATVEQAEQSKGDNSVQQAQPAPSAASGEPAALANEESLPQQEPIKPKGLTMAGLPVWLVLTVAVSLFFIVVVFCLVLCLCVRFRSRRKVLTIVKEPEKKALPADNFYTVGVPPPQYEVNGIPQLSYEEAKGEMIRGDTKKKEEDKEEQAEEK